MLSLRVGKSNILRLIFTEMLGPPEMFEKQVEKKWFWNRYSYFLWNISGVDFSPYKYKNLTFGFNKYCKYVCIRLCATARHGLFHIYFCRCRNGSNGKGASLICKETWFRVQFPMDKNKNCSYSLYKISVSGLCIVCQ